MQYKVIGPGPSAIVEGELNQLGAQEWQLLHFIALPLAPSGTNYTATNFVAVVGKGEWTQVRKGAPE